MAWYRPRARALAACTAAVAGLALLPGVASAAPSPSVASVAAQVEALQERAGSAAEAYNGAKLDLAQVQSRLAKAQGKLSTQQKAVAAATSTMGALAAAQYRSGGMDANLELLLSDDPATFLQQAASLDQISAHQTELVRKVAVARAQMAQTQLAIAQQAAQVKATRDQLAARKAAIEGDLAKAQRLLSSLKAEERARLLAAQRLADERAAAASRAARSAARAALLSAQDQPAAASSFGSSGSSGTDTSSSSDGSSGSAGSASPSPSGSGGAGAAVAYAYSKLGSPYVWGAAGPNVFDCSGLTMRAWAAAGVSIPHFSGAQYGAGRRVSRSDLQPGDLVFFYSPSEHVGIYVGGGMVIHAPRPGSSVKLAPVGSMPYAGAVRP